MSVLSLPSSYVVDDEVDEVEFDEDEFDDFEESDEPGSTTPASKLTKRNVLTGDMV